MIISESKIQKYDHKNSHRACADQIDLKTSETSDFFFKFKIFD